jgi:hypothetical protein
MPPQQDWFSQNAPPPAVVAGGGDWFAQNAPKSSAPSSTDPSDTRNGLQRAFDSFAAPRMASDEGTPHPFPRAAENVARGAVGGFGAPFIHPLQTIKGMADIGNAATSGNALQMADALHIPEMVESVREHPAETAESAAGNALGGAALGEVLPRVIGPVAGAVERGGLELGNNALGARGPKPFKYGANPARGAFEEGVLPALSKHSAGMKLEHALPDAGQRISDAVMGSGSTVPAASIVNSIEKPIMDTGEVMSGFGGGKPLDPVTNLWASTEEKAPNASAPIYGPNAPANVAAPDLWHSIRNLDKNTRFNPDPEVEGVNELRRDMRGGLRGNLEDAVPGLKPLTQRYQDLSSAQEALERTMHSGTGLRRAMDVPMFPLESTVGRGMYEAGKIGPLSHAFAPAAPVSSLIESLRDKKKEQ